jgi:hypothetical protein
MDFRIGDEVGVIDDKGRVRGPYTILGRPTEHDNRGLWQHQWLLSNYLPIYESMLVRWYPGLSKDYGPIPSREEIEELKREINRKMRKVYQEKTGESGEPGHGPANLISNFLGTYKKAEIVGKKRGRNGTAGELNFKTPRTSRKTQNRRNSRNRRNRRTQRR